MFHGFAAEASFRSLENSGNFLEHKVSRSRCEGGGGHVGPGRKVAEFIPEDSLHDCGILLNTDANFAWLIWPPEGFRGLCCRECWGWEEMGGDVGLRYVHGREHAVLDRGFYVS